MISDKEESKESKFPLSIPFIIVKQSGQFQITQQSMEWIQTLGDIKVSISVVVGPWRSGKSFLSSLLSGRMDSFSTGSTIKPCTRGFWLCTKPIKRNEQFVELIMDTEGLFSTDRSQTSDINIALLSVLLSSQFIFNSMGALKDDVIRKLGLVAQITKYFYLTQQEQGMSAEEKIKQYSKVAPKFVWILRDSTLKFKQGETASSYLEERLNFRSDDVDQVELYEVCCFIGQFVQAIKNFFNQRNCFSLVRPIFDDSKLKNLSTMKKSDLRPEFNSELDQLLKWFSMYSSPKVVQNKIMTASAFHNLASQYITAINSHTTPVISAAVENVIAFQIVKIQEETIEFAKEQFKITVHSTKQAINQGNLIEHMRRTIIQAQNFYFSKIYQIFGYQETIQSTKNMRSTILNILHSEKRDTLQQRNAKDFEELNLVKVEQLVKQLLQEDEQMGRDKQIIDVLNVMEKKFNVIRGKNQSISLAASILASFKEVVIPSIKELAQKMQKEIQTKLVDYRRNFSILDVEIQSQKLQIQDINKEEQKYKNLEKEKREELSTLTLKQQSIKRKEGIHTKDFQSQQQAISAQIQKKQQEYHKKKQKEKQQISALLDQKSRAESQYQILKQQNKGEERRQKSYKVKYEEQINFYSDQIEGGKKQMERMEIDKMFEKMKKKFKNFKDFLKKLEKEKMLKQDIRMLERSIHERQTQGKLLELSQKVEKSKDLSKKRVSLNQKLDISLNKAAQSNQQIQNLKRQKLKQELEINLLNQSIKLKEKQTVAIQNYITTVDSLGEVTNRTIKYKAFDLDQLVKEYERGQKEKVKFSVKLAEEQMSREDLISFFSAIIINNKQRSAESMRTVAFIFKKKIQKQLREKLLPYFPNFS